MLHDLAVVTYSVFKLIYKPCIFFFATSTSLVFIVRVDHEFCFPFWKDSHAYSKGKALVVSKVPLPDYRVDLDERHGSTQKEVIEMNTSK